MPRRKGRREKNEKTLRPLRLRAFALKAEADKTDQPRVTIEMDTHNLFIVIGTEEPPPKALRRLSEGQAYFEASEMPRFPMVKEA